MKTLRYLTICLAVCCLFAVNVFAVPTNVGVSVSIRAEFQGTDDLAFVAEEGDILEYYVTVSLSDDQFPIFDGEPQLVLPDGTIIDLDDALVLPTGGSEAYAPVAYVVSAADLGQQAGAASNEVRALASVTAKADTTQTIQDVSATTNFDTIVINPCIDVDKVASCDIAKEGDIYNYTITISNCGGDDLTVVSIDDTMFGSLLPDCGTLAPGADCVIQIPYEVQPDDPDLIENTVTVVYAVTGIPAITVTDTSDAEVEVVHPDFTVTKTCLTDGVIADEVTFEIVITNTGDIPLDFATDEASIAPFSLDAGAPPSVHQVVVPVTPGETEVQNTVNVVATIPAEYVCGDNPATIEKQASDTCTVLEADFTVTKECTTPEVQVGDDATFHITITNTGDVPLSFTTNEPELWIQEPIVLGPGGVFEADVNRTTMSGMDIISNTIEVTGTYEDITIVKEDSADCDVIEATEGCTPGFWKNHPDCWGCYTPETLVSEVFTVLGDPNYLYAAYSDSKSDFDADSLMEAMNYKGGTGVAGATRNLLRHATAALQNACNQNVQYPLTVDGVIDMVNDALDSENVATINGAKNLLAMFNEYGCPINAACELNGSDEPEPTLN
jgi:hypothetical protein